MASLRSSLGGGAGVVAERTGGTKVKDTECGVRDF